MIERRHTAGDAESLARYSPCGRYRYLLSRCWDGSRPRLLFVMLNPSTATEAHNDPTVARCERRARAMGCGSVRVANLFAFRATDPGILRTVADPVGPGNDAALLDSAARADIVICAWGTGGVLHGRGAAVERLLRGAGAALHHLGLTRDGHPRHPLYLRGDCPALPWG